MNTFMTDATTTISKQEKRWVIISLSSIPLIMTLGNSMLIPVLPMLEDELNISKLESSYIITVYSVVAIFLIPLAGYLSDRFGRKKIIIPSLIITAIGGLVASIAAWGMEEAFVVILIGRILQGIGASGALPIVIPLIGDIFMEEEEANETLGLIETANTIGKVLSPILGAVLAAIIWFLPFVSIPILCTASAMMIGFFVKNKGGKEKDFLFRDYISEIKSSLREHIRWVLAVFFIGAILMFILFGLLFYTSSILEDDFNFTGVWKGFLLAAPLLALATAAYITGKYIGENLKLMKWITVSGIFLLICSLIFIPLSENYLYLLFLFLLSGIGIGVSLPCLDALITNFDKSIRGIITSFYSAMRFLGVAAGPLVIAMLMKYSLIWMIFLLTFFALVAFILAFKNITPS